MAVSLVSLTSQPSYSDKSWLTNINFAHQILKKQFPKLSGLWPTLLLSRSPQIPIPTDSLYLQIIQTNGNHWVVASTIGCLPKIQVYDFLYSSVSSSTLESIRRQFGLNVCVKVGTSPHQDGLTDCRVFAIGTGIAVANGSRPGELFREGLRNHLVACFESTCLLPFP